MDVPGITTDYSELTDTPNIQPVSDIHWRRNQYGYTAIASFAMTGKVLGAYTYASDRPSEISPVDVVLCWGAVAQKEAPLEGLNVTHENRVFKYIGSEEAPANLMDLQTHVVNLHLVPDGPFRYKQIQELEKGQTIKIRGYLVNIEEGKGDSEWHWDSSLLGLGANKILWVTELEVD